MKREAPQKQYHRKHAIVYSCQYHVIFCPKYRHPVFKDGIDERLKERIVEKQEDYDDQVIEMEIMPDHVHLL